VTLVRADISEERVAFIIKLKIISSVLQLLVTADVPSSVILATLMMNAIHSSETSVLTKHMASNPRRLFFMDLFSSSCEGRQKPILLGFLVRAK
jgi:hypothetical protein